MGNGRTYFTPTTGEDLGVIKDLGYHGDPNHNPHWVHFKCRKTQFASAKNAPGPKPIKGAAPSVMLDEDGKVLSAL